MSPQFKVFEKNVERIRSMSSIIHGVKFTPVVDVSDIYRFQWVMVIAALDNFVRQLTLHGIMETYDGKRTSKQEFTMQVETKTCREFSQGTLDDGRTSFMRYVLSRLEQMPFQDSKQIKKAMSYCGIEDIWQRINNNTKSDKQLDVISKRRHQITHQFDMIENYGLQEMQKISYEDVIQVIDYIYNVALKINNLFYATPPTN
jgi:hypothetical protein